MTQKQQETTALVPLLSLLHDLWNGSETDPAKHLNAELICGDAAWDTEACTKTCAVDYGLNSVWRLHREQGPFEIQRGTVKGDKLLRYDHDGTVYCAAHDEAVEYDTLDRPSRTGLKAGQASRETAFRYRLRCKHDHRRGGGHPPCGRPTLPASLDWRRFTYYPHHGNGRPELYAMRQVLTLARLGQVESCFSALKGGNKLGGGGAARTRIRERHVHEALISLAFLGRVALTTVDQLQQRNAIPKTPPSKRGPVLSAPGSIHGLEPGDRGIENKTAGLRQPADEAVVREPSPVPSGTNACDVDCPSLAVPPTNCSAQRPRGGASVVDGVLRTSATRPGRWVIVG